MPEPAHVFPRDDHEHRLVARKAEPAARRGSVNDLPSPHGSGDGGRWAPPASQPHDGLPLTFTGPPSKHGSRLRPGGGPKVPCYLAAVRRAPSANHERARLVALPLTLPEHAKHHYVH
jgi:hypothetical protein